MAEDRSICSSSLTEESKRTRSKLTLTCDPAAMLVGYDACPTFLRMTSFGYDIGLSKFLEEADDYLRRLQIMLSDEPARAVHMKKGGVIVGQLEIGAPLDADTGKLNLV